MIISNDQCFIASNLVFVIISVFIYYRLGGCRCRLQEWLSQAPLVGLSTNRWTLSPHTGGGKENEQTPGWKIFTGANLSPHVETRWKNLEHLQTFMKDNLKFCRGVNFWSTWEHRGIPQCQRKHHQRHCQNIKYDSHSHSRSALWSKCPALQNTAQRWIYHLQFITKVVLPFKIDIKGGFTIYNL